MEWLLLDLNEQIHEALTAKRVTRSELAERLGTSRAFVTKLLSGHENVTLKTLIRVASALDCTLALTVGGRGRGKAKTPVAATEPRRHVRARKAG